MRALAILLGTLALAVGGCGGESPDDALSATAAKLGEIRSATMSLRFVAGAEGGEEVGFELRGPFSLEGAGGLPIADIEVTQIAGSERGTTRFIATGDKAFLEVEDSTYELAPEEFRTPPEESGEESPFAELRIEDWFVDPELSNGGEVGGAETDRVRAKLNVVAALNDLLAAARELGGVELSSVEGANAVQVENAVESAVVEVHTGTEDRLLRRLVMDVDFGVDAPKRLRETLGGLAGAHLAFELELANLNEQVTVEEPVDAIPFEG